MRAMRRSVVAVVSVAAALTLSACGGSTDGATSVESSSAAKGGVAESQEEPEAAEGEATDGEATEVETEEIPDSSELSSNSLCPGVFWDVLRCLDSNGNFKYFLTGLSDVQLDELASGGPLTVFAPTDEAFEALGDEVLGLLQEDEGLREEILARHIVEGAYLTPDFFREDPRFIDVVGFSGVETDLDGVLYVEGAVVNPGDNIVDNGIIHVIDQVLVPEQAPWD